MTEGPNGLTMGVRVSPSAKQTRLRGLLGDRLKVQIAAPPEDGRANEELLAALASWLQVPRAAVSLTQGSTGKDKLVTVSGISRSQLAERVSRLVART